ncbi:uncharacterized protein L201_005284 [Kwoniella dendrophila CBS 6074]|uniref:Uncharacterized protein n=1 Tax=Kwoniella dendrophila CBS 6074 TaxID=1295534 RepID=A0AAX4JYQ3_9TREE
MTFSTKLTLFSALMTLLPFVTLTGAADSTVKIKISEYTHWQSSYNTDMVFADERDITFSEEDIKKGENEQKFFWIGYKHLDTFQMKPRWNMSCYVKVDKPLEEQIEFTLRDENKAGFIGNKDTPAQIWCPQEEAKCYLKDEKCEGVDVIPIVDSVSIVYV